MPKKKSANYFGGTQFERIVPSVSPGAPCPRVLNLRLTLEQALMLNLAIGACAHELNSLNRKMKTGTNQGVAISIKPDATRIDVLIGKVP